RLPLRGASAGRWGSGPAPTEPGLRALADQVRGEMAGLGPIGIVPDGGVLPDAEIAARIGLADVAHCLQLDREASLSVSTTAWAALAAQLSRLRGSHPRAAPARPLRRSPRRCTIGTSRRAGAPRVGRLLPQEEGVGDVGPVNLLGLPRTRTLRPMDERVAG